MKTNLMVTFMLGISTLIASQSYASSNVAGTYSVVKKGVSTGVTFKVPYTAGVHSGKASSIRSDVQINADGSLKKAVFAVPIAAMTTGNAVRDCHMREALGIDYQNSSFPKKHVCDSDNQLPASGPDAVVYPDVAFQFSGLSANAIALPPQLEVGQIHKIEVQGRWLVHGKERAMTTAGKTMVVSVERVAGDESLIRLKTDLTLSLKEFGVIVKPFKLGPIEIGVGDAVRVQLDLLLQKVQ